MTMHINAPVDAARTVANDAHSDSPFFAADLRFVF